MSATINEESKNNPANEHLEKLRDAVSKVPPDENSGYNFLMSDLTELFMEALHYEFDDFKNTKYATPKVMLVMKLKDISEAAKNGKYDN